MTQCFKNETKKIQEEQTNVKPHPIAIFFTYKTTAVSICET